MRKSVRGAIVGAALLPLAVAGPGMAFAGSTGYDEAPKKEHSKHDGDHKDGDHKDGDHERGHHKHDKKHHHKETDHKTTEEEESEGPLPTLPSPIQDVVDTLTGVAPLG